MRAMAAWTSGDLVYGGTIKPGKLGPCDLHRGQAL